MMLSVVLLSNLSMLLSDLNGIKILRCGNGLSWLLELNLTFKTVLFGDHSNAGKTQLDSFDS